MGFLKNKSFWLMLFIVALGAVLRLIFIDKPDGLWNDEYVSWAVASTPLGKGFWDAVFAQCHMPFYYFYLKFFMHFFGQSDLLLRLTSVFTGVLSIIPMYFIGKELENKEHGEKLGILCAAIASLSSFLIYFSQEVRFYALLFLFSALTLLFTLKLVKEQSIKNIIGFIISNLLIIFTHTIGFIYVIFNLIFVGLYLSKNKENKKIITAISASLVGFILICAPLLYMIFSPRTQSQFWGHFTFSKLAFMLTDYFSPILINPVSLPDSFIGSINPNFTIFAIIPTLIALIGIIKTLISKDKKILGLFLVCLAYLSTLIIAAVFGKLIFITKYSIEIYPTLILLMAFGLLEFKKAWRYLFVFVFCFLNLFYIISNPTSTPKLHRPEGHKIVADLLNNAQLNSGDYILFNYYGQDRFKKYFDIDKYNTYSINKVNYSDYLGAKNKDDFKKIDNRVFNKNFKKDVLDKLKPNQKLSVVILKDVAMYSPTQMYSLLKNENAYNNVPFMFLAFSQVKNDTLRNCLQNLQILRIEEKGSWAVITFKKN